jgi:YfiH family protein
VCAFSTTRHGGTSEGNHASLNINPYCGDKPEHVAANRNLLAAELGISTDRLILPHQTHGTETRIIGPEFCTLPEQIRQMLLEGVDALLTNVEGVCIGVSTADCIPVLLYDEEHRATAAIHAGWRGTQARIVSKAIVDMGVAYKTDTKKLKAVIGPGISQKNFEVIADLGSGMNYQKKGLRRLLNQIIEGKVGRLVVTHKDRLLRFGAELVFAICEAKGVEVVILNRGDDTSFEEDLAKDVLEIITVFSARLYGSRSRKNQRLIDTVKKAAEDAQG